MDQQGPIISVTFVVTMNEISGILENGILEILPDFSERTLISSHGPFVISKAKRFGKWVKLKSLAPECRGNAFYEELLKKEFSIGISLDHPNIARTDSYLHDEELGNSILEEFVDGMTLGEWLASHPGKSERRKAADQLLEAMEYIHGKGVVHRDIKPSNIIITSVGANLKLIDFGLSDTSEYAILKQRVGTSGYIAPEVLKENGKDYDRALADIYSLGVVLRDLKAGFPYGNIARRAMKTDPAKRWRNVLEMLRTLHRHRRTANAAAILLLAAALATGTALITLGISAREERRSAAVLETAFEQADSSLADYYLRLEEILNRSADSQEWNTSTTAFYARFGYPIQFVDSLTALYSSRHALNEDASVKLHLRLTTRMNELHNDRYAPKIRERWRKNLFD